jgi:NhaA family Na+:H+ antiporter
MSTAEPGAPQRTRRSPTAALRQFFRSQSAGGVILALAATLALVVSNSGAASWYEALLRTPAEVRIGALGLVLSKPLLLWVNELWMAVFFLFVGLEIKRELIEGELATWRQAVLPAVAALGGMILPALIYAAINRGDPVALRGWAIPAATDIAFALGIVMLLGARVPVSLKVFLTAVAIIDDLGAIVVIALFYTSEVSTPMLMAAGVGGLALLALNRLGVTRADVFVVVGLVTWVCVLKSGVHATLAGVATALAVPMRDARGRSPVEALEHGLHFWVAFIVLPVFAFCNAGVALAGVAPATLLQGIPLGIALGLMVGKMLGVFGLPALLIRSGRMAMPAGASWRQFFGTCALCGIGFTMSLFIGGLAFEELDPGYMTQVKLGVLGGSVLAGIVGTLVLVGARRDA